MQDKTESIRMAMAAIVNATVESSTPETERARLEAEHGKGNVFDTGELTRRFEVMGFMAPFCMVRERETGEKGTVMFQHSPRFYFGFEKA